MSSFVCWLLASHKWERVQTPSEEAYRCRRCGKRHYGKLHEPSRGPFVGGGDIGGGGAGGFGNGGGGP
jgi:hypothetical protein